MNLTKDDSHPHLSIRVGHLSAFAADTIYATAHTGYWGQSRAIIGPKTGLIQMVEYTEHDENRAQIATRTELLMAINDILSGKHVGSALREQAIRDVLEWQDSPDYGPPFDAELCDAIVQIAALGEVRYG